MKKTILLIMLFSLMAAPAFADYKIYLKNGSVIKGVGSYREVNGEVRFRYMGGTVGIPIADVLKIQEVGEAGAVTGTGEGPGVPERRTPVVPSYQQGPIDSGPDTSPIKRKIAQIDARLKQINARTAKYDEMKKEYDQVRLRIEVLFQRGVAEAKKQNGDPAKWFLFLPEQERQWAQLNTLKKNKMQKEIEELERRNAPLLEEKDQLLLQRQELLQQLKEMENPF